ncbi:sorting nexin-3 isoform X2 [Phyllopteryx taeniolatus]|uniref:sorting nexin-3 isoform X2 n=1 Tax=Phyllopteryx taeniolatus TaxID=161469 RepID=UPI002AD4885D|nr:sorting nexin-3 isoform X2 [Phyllopteryx taeniolatus]
MENLPSCSFRIQKMRTLMDLWMKDSSKNNTNLPIFKLKESSVRRRYSDFEWLRAELERESKVVVPPLPGKALIRQLPFRGDDGIFDDSFIEERRQGLEQFLNKVAGHPLAQNERCLHMFLQDESVDKHYTPSKVRQA